MIYVGIDIAKNKHDCFITNLDGEVLFKSFTISNNREGFETLFWCCIIKVDTLFSRILIYNHNQYENRRKTYGTESKIL